MQYFKWDVYYLVDIYLSLCMITKIYGNLISGITVVITLHQNLVQRVSCAESNISIYIALNELPLGDIEIMFAFLFLDIERRVRLFQFPPSWSQVLLSPAQSISCLITLHTTLFYTIHFSEFKWFTCIFLYILAKYIRSSFMRNLLSC